MNGHHVGAAVLLVGAIALIAFSAACQETGEVRLTNDTGWSADGVSISFSEPVKIRSWCCGFGHAYDDRTSRMEGSAQQIFGAGVVQAGEEIRIQFEPQSAEVLEVQWLDWRQMVDLGLAPSFSGTFYLGERVFDSRLIGEFDTADAYGQSFAAVFVWEDWTGTDLETAWSGEDGRFWCYGLPDDRVDGQLLAWCKCDNDSSFSLGDFDLSFYPLNLSAMSREERLSLKLPIYAHIHVTSPVDLAETGQIPWPGIPTLESPVLFAWEPVPEAASYTVEIDLALGTQDSEDIREILYQTGIVDCRLELPLPSTSDDEHYRFSVVAFDSKGNALTLPFFGWSDEDFETFQFGVRKDTSDQPALHTEQLYVNLAALSGSQTWKPYSGIVTLEIAGTVKIGDAESTEEDAFFAFDAQTNQEIGGPSYGLLYSRILAGSSAGEMIPLCFEALRGIPEYSYLHSYTIQIDLGSQPVRLAIGSGPHDAPVSGGYLVTITGMSED